MLIFKLHDIQDTQWAKTIASYSFYAAVALEIIIVLWDKFQYINPIEGRMFQVTFALCVIKVIFTKYDIKEYITVFLFCLLGLAVDHFGGRNEILRMFMFIAACKGVDMKRCLKYVFWMTSIGCALIVLLSVTGIYGEVTVLKRYQEGDLLEMGVDKVRYCFGMGNPNSFHIMMTVLTLLGLFIYNEKIRWWTYLLLILADGLIFYFTRCKTGAIIMAFAPIVFATERYASERILRFLDRLFALFSVAFVIFSIWLATLAEEIRYLYFVKIYNIEDIWLYKLNKLLTGRIMSLAENEKYEGAAQSWSLFTQPGHDKYVDLGYVRLYYWYGIIPASIILVAFLILMIYLIKENKHYEMTLLFVVAVFTVIEAHFVSVYIGRCYPLFILGEYWPFILRWRKNKNEQQLVQNNFEI